MGVRPTLKLRNSAHRQRPSERDRHPPALGEATVPVGRARGNRAAGRSTDRGTHHGGLGLLAEDLPVLPLWHEDNVAIVNADVSGLKVAPNGRLSGLARATKVKRQ